MTAYLSPQDLRDAQELLNDLFTAVSAEEGTLAGGTKLGIGGTALQGLRETKVLFGSPNDDLVQLTPRLFDEIGIELSELRKRQMREQFDFYYMTLAVSMQPKRGAQFRRVECKLDFGPKGADEVIVQGIFPTSEWREVLSWGGEMRLELNGNLEWSAAVSIPQQALNLLNLPGSVQAHIANKDTLRAFVAIPHYSFKLGRAEIVATGEGNSQCFWRIETPELREEQTVKFGVVFKVPKGTPSIELNGLVAVEPSMNWLVTNVRDVFEHLSETFQNLLRRNYEERSGKDRLPLGDHEQWTLLLPRKF